MSVSSVSSSEVEYDPIVIDSGSGMCEGGFAGDDAPRLSFPTVIGSSLRSQHPNPGMISANVYGDRYIGDTAQRMRGILSLEYPMEHGIVTDWDKMDKIWMSIFKNLLVDPANRHIVLPQVPLNPKAHTEKMAQMMFEAFDAKGLIIPETSKLSIYSSGYGSAISLDSGDGVTTVYPVYEGHTPRTAVKRIDFGGRDLTHYLMKLLRGKSDEGRLIPSTTSGREIVREIKEKHCYCALDRNSLDSTSFKNVDYKLPDGRSIELDKELVQCPEAIFNPSLFDLKLPGIQQLIHDSVAQCSIDCRTHFSWCIIVNGRNTLFPGFSERLQLELSNLTPKYGKFRVRAPPERAYSVWIGGSILGSLSITKFVSRAEYNEYGPSICSRMQY